jgi:hypothetical protein
MTKEQTQNTKDQMWDWADKILSATKEGNQGQLIASIHGYLGCRTVLLENRVEELEEQMKSSQPIGGSSHDTERN